MKFGLSLTYNDIFSEEKPDIKDLIKEIPSGNAIELISYLLAQIHSENGDEFLQKDLIDFVSQRFPLDIKEKINKFYRKIKANAFFKFIDNVSGLIFLENILENHNSLPRVDDLTPEQELNFFKAYLLSTDIWISKKDSIFSNLKEIKTNVDFNKAYIPTHIPYTEFNIVKDFRIQFIKAKMFFEFCEEDIHFKEYLKTFLDEYKVESWKIYLKNILSLYIRKFERLKTPSEIIVSEEFPELKNFLSSLTLNLDNFKKSDDFFCIRETPIYKINEERYIFLNLNLFIDKIFQGIQFDFARILIKNNSTYKGKTIARVDQFFSIISNEFSENYLFYRVVENCFSRNKYILKSGKSIRDEFENGGEPDYYIRDKAKIYLFEYKNVLINSKVKHSFDYEIIKNSLIEKFVINKNNTAKGISQIINIIHKIDNEEFKNIDTINTEEAIIYPIIVFTDVSLNTTGINNLLNDEYKNLLHNNTFTKIKNFKDLVMIDLDTLIKYEDLFFERKIKLNYVINNYLETVKGIGNFTRKFISFELFMDNLTHKLDSKLSEKSIEMIAKVLEIE